MSKLNQLVGKAKKIKLGDIELDIRPLTVSSMPLLMQVGKEGDPEAQAEAMKEIVSTTLKDSVPEATDDEIGNIPLEHMTKLMEEIMEINKLDMKDKEFIENIKKRQNERTGKVRDKKGTES